jgi:pimeloyl-ACP methyl ester carboxylesterase
MRIGKTFLLRLKLYFLILRTEIAILFPQLRHRLLLFTGLVCTLLCVQLFAGQEKEMPFIKNIVLVHGAWVDGSSWSKVIPLLESKGFNVTAVQLSLASFADDVATTKRALALEDGPVLLVGHSYGGAVITEAGNDPRVAGLVYVAAVAPDQGESTADLLVSVPTPLSTELRSDASGFLKLTPKGMAEDFAQCLPDREIEVLAAAQAPTNIAAVSGQVTSPAWRAKPSWYIVASQDRAISPSVEQMLAKRINATTITLSTCHVAMLGEPDRVADFIAKAGSKGDRE